MGLVIFNFLKCYFLNAILHTIVRKVKTACSLNDSVLYHMKWCVLKDVREQSVLFLYVSSQYSLDSKLIVCPGGELLIWLCQVNTLVSWTEFLCRLRSIATHRDHFVRPSVCLSVRLSHSHTYVSQATHAFLGMLPLFFHKHVYLAWNISINCCYLWTVCSTSNPNNLIYMHKNVKLMKKAIFYNMWIFSNLPQNVDKIPNSKGPGPRTKICCDGPDIFIYFPLTLPSLCQLHQSVAHDRWK